MVFKITSSKSHFRQGQSGLTLFELLVAMGVGAILLTQVCCLWFYSTRSFASQMAYVELDQRSQRALDTLSRDIRQVKAITYFATNRLRFIGVDDLPLEFHYHNGILWRVKNNNMIGASKLLTECDGLNFAMYQRVPIEGKFEYYPATDLNTCKLIEVRWICSRKLFPTAPSTTESVQSSKIVLRSHKQL